MSNNGLKLGLFCVAVQLKKATHMNDEVENFLEIMKTGKPAVLNGVST